MSVTTSVRVEVVRVALLVKMSVPFGTERLLSVWGCSSGPLLHEDLQWFHEDMTCMNSHQSLLKCGKHIEGFLSRTYLKLAATINCRTSANFSG